MSRFGKRNDESVIRIEMMLIKLKVIIALFTFSKVEIEKDVMSNYMEEELKTWSSSRHITFSVKEVECPIYIKGHSLYDTHSTRHCKKLSFSKK